MVVIYREANLTARTHLYPSARRQKAISVERAQQPADAPTTSADKYVHV